MDIFHISEIIVSVHHSHKNQDLTRYSSKANKYNYSTAQFTPTQYLNVTLLKYKGSCFPNIRWKNYVRENEAFITERSVCH